MRHAPLTDNSARLLLGKQPLAVLHSAYRKGSTHQRHTARMHVQGELSVMNDARVPRDIASALFAVGTLLILTAMSPQCIGAPPDTNTSWTADNGNGTYSNPLFYEEFEDPDVIRVGDDYYLAGTTMHMNPAVQLMHSKDLVNWELAGYCMDRLDLGPAFRLEGGNIYGRGIWAPCIRYHQGMFYVFSNVNGVGLQVFRSKSIEGPWERNQLPGRHDLSVLFDDDGKVYIISGNRSPYPIEELSPDLRSFVPSAPQSLLERRGWAKAITSTRSTASMSTSLRSPAVRWTRWLRSPTRSTVPGRSTRMVEGESLGVTAAAPRARRTRTTAVCGCIKAASSTRLPAQWWSIIMSDHGSAGRMVSLVPVTWDDGFPLIGLPGNLRKAPNTWIKPDTGHTQEPKPAFIHDDDFDSGRLNPHWQWNHVPDDSKWSMTEKPGVLRLHSLPAADFYSARNSLCQRPPGPESIMTVEMDTSGMVAGDTAGLALLSSPYAWIGVVKSAEGPTLQMYSSSQPRPPIRPPRLRAVQANEPVVSPTAPPEHLWLRVHCNFDNDQAVFSWSADGKKFTPLGNPFTMTFQLTTFQGVRPALFHYNTSGQSGGYVDFDNYTVDEPRARGIEREIPLGKTIVLTSGADGSVLAADLEASTLVNLPAGDDIPAQREVPSHWPGSGTRGAEGQQRKGCLGCWPRERRPQEPRRCEARRRGDLPVDQPDARRHDAHVADQSPLSRDEAQLARPSDRYRHRSQPGSQGRRLFPMEGSFHQHNRLTAQSRDFDISMNQSIFSSSLLILISAGVFFRGIP